MAASADEGAPALSEHQPILEQLEQIDSTNAELMRRLQAGAQGSMAIYALKQTAGRGRNGKRWDAPSSGLYYSQSFVFNSKPSALAGLSLALGVAAVDALHEASAPQTNLKISLKWPNDLWIGRKKLGGILIEIAANLVHQSAMQTTVVAGIGINLAGTNSEDRTDLAAHGACVNAATLAPIMLAHWQRAARKFSEGGFAGFHSRWAALDMLAGQDVVLSDNPQLVWRADGVAADGALQLRNREGDSRLVASGEVSLSTRLSIGAGERP